MISFRASATKQVSWRKGKLAESDSKSENAEIRADIAPQVSETLIRTGRNQRQNLPRHFSYKFIHQYFCTVLVASCLFLARHGDFRSIRKTCRREQVPKRSTRRRWRRWRRGYQVLGSKWREGARAGWKKNSRRLAGDDGGNIGSVWGDDLRTDGAVSSYNRAVLFAHHFYELDY